MKALNGNVQSIDGFVVPCSTIDTISEFMSPDVSQRIIGRDVLAMVIGTDPSAKVLEANYVGYFKNIDSITQMTKVTRIDC